MKGNTSNKVRLKCPCKSLWGVQYYFIMGRHIFVIEKKDLQNFFTVTQIIYFLLAAQVLLKIIVSVEPCLASVVVWEAALVRMSMRLGRKKITVYSLQKTRLHHCTHTHTHTRDNTMLFRHNHIIIISVLVSQLNGIICESNIKIHRIWYH